MRILLISTFTMALYVGPADSQPPESEPAPTQAEHAETDEATSSGRLHARAAQRMARARHNSDSAPGPDRRRSGLPVSDTVVNQPAIDPDPDR
ncbi:hypothetical protein [Maricaulis maris]|uniref:Uncharacterized protein n=1 Tax=Maricaulis maris TaxID=74318 RepID=A0A495DCR8_9PROT|nr:hypothetical protein [Maricaulis maris]RKR00127.1 hypothetical protein C7435_1327 [Maricaulis maris]